MDTEAMKTLDRQQLEELLRRYPPNSSEGVQVREERRRRMQRWGQVANVAWTLMLLCALLIAMVTWLN